MYTYKYKIYFHETFFLTDSVCKLTMRRANPPNASAVAALLLKVEKVRLLDPVESR